MVRLIEYINKTDTSKMQRWKGVGECQREKRKKGKKREGREETGRPITIQTYHVERECLGKAL